MDDRARGFTLIEALIVMLIAAILLTIAVPAWSSAMSAAHNGAARSALASSLLDAVRRSALTGGEVVMCPDTGAAQCNGSVDWSGGWIVFADRNGNRARDANEPLVHHAAALEGGVQLRSTAGRTRLVFQPNGGNAGSNVTFTLCDGRGLAKATTVVLGNDGRLRSGKPTFAAAQACMAAL
ncbi:MAG: GspH/FimT family pseudopilin [Luteimonas sp.]